MFASVHIEARLGESHEGGHFEGGLTISPGVRCAPILLGTPGEIAIRIPFVVSHYRHDKET